MRQLLLAALGGSLSGCGTILHPERRGQPKGQLDWGVVLLDGLCLLLFFIPGVIAFAVDFGTGAIYLPPESVGAESGVVTDDSLGFVQVQVPPADLSDSSIAAAVSKRIGRNVSLDSPECHREPLPSLADFRARHERLLALHSLPATHARTVLRAQSR